MQPIVADADQYVSRRPAFRWNQPAYRPDDNVKRARRETAGPPPISDARIADRFDTPRVSRWTWLIGAGWTYVLMGRDEEALPWVERSVAITPASGRPLMLLAAIHQRLGQPDKAKAALAKALELRPGTTALNVWSSTKNASPAFIAAQERMIRSVVEVGLPER